MDDNLPQNTNSQSTQTQPPVQPALGQTPPVQDIQPPAAQQPAVKPQPQAISSFSKEGEPMVIEKKEFHLPKEIKEAGVEEIKPAEEIKLPQPIKDEFGEILLESALPVKPKIVLPLAKAKAQKALHVKFADSIKWLAVWCLRLIKMFPERVSYKAS